MATLYTIGHSTRTLDELVSALKAHGIETLVDIRSFPMSRRFLHFNREFFGERVVQTRNPLRLDEGSGWISKGHTERFS